MLRRQARVIAFVKPAEDPEMSTLLSDIAAALSARDRRVGTVHISQETAAWEIDLWLAANEVDLILVDLPFRPTPGAGSVLSGCDLIIVPSSCKIEYLAEAENIVKALLYLGIDTDKVAGIVFDPEGILSRASLDDIKPYLESSLGVGMAGVVSYDPGTDGRMLRDIEQVAGYLLPRVSRELEPSLSGA